MSSRARRAEETRLTTRRYSSATFPKLWKEATVAAKYVWRTWLITTASSRPSMSQFWGASPGRHFLAAAPATQATTATPTTTSRTGNPRIHPTHSCGRMNKTAV